MKSVHRISILAACAALFALAAASAASASSHPRFIQGTKTRHRTQYNHQTRSRQDTPTTHAPSDSDFELTSVSPIQSSLGGLTGLQGLPPLSLIQFVKLLVAVTPFIVPIIFVPLLLFTVGMFMIPVNKAGVFFEGNGRAKYASPEVSSWPMRIVNAVTTTDNCFELIACKAKGAVFGATLARRVDRSDRFYRKFTISNLTSFWL